MREISTLPDREKLAEARTFKLTRELVMRMELVGLAGPMGAERVRRLIEREVRRLEKRRLSA